MQSVVNRGIRAENSSGAFARANLSLRCVCVCAMRGVIACILLSMLLCSKSPSNQRGGAHRVDADMKIWSLRWQNAEQIAIDGVHVVAVDDLTSSYICAGREQRPRECAPGTWCWAANCMQRSYVIIYAILHAPYLYICIWRAPSQISITYLCSYAAGCVCWEYNGERERKREEERFRCFVAGRKLITFISWCQPASKYWCQRSRAPAERTGSPSAEFVNFYDMADIGAWTYTYMIWILIL